MATAAVLVFLDWWFRFGVAVRILLLILSVAAVAAFLGVRAVRRWRSSRLDELSLAMTLDRFRPGVGQQIADVLQLPDLLGEPAASASPAMVRLAVRPRVRRAGRVGLAVALEPQADGHARRGFVAGPARPRGVRQWSAPDAARLSVARWLLGSSERWPQRTYLTVMGLDDRGRLLVPRDEPFLLEVRSDLPMVEPSGDRWIVRGRGEPLVLRRKPASPTKPPAVVVRERTAEEVPARGRWSDVGPAQFRYEFPAVVIVVDLRADRRRRLARPDRARARRPAVAGRDPAARPGARGDLQGFRDVEDPRQHLVFLPDTEVELTLDRQRAARRHPAQDPVRKPRPR